MIIQGDARRLPLQDKSINCCVTSPPYFGLRDYGNNAQIGLESTPDAYVAEMVVVFREVWRVLRDDGTLWLNLGDSYNAYNANRGKSTSISDGTNGRGHLTASRGLLTPELKNKDLIGIPWRVAFALQADGWYLRQDIIWSKPNLMPESVKDRCTKSHEYLFLLSKKARYWYDAEAVKEPSVDPVGSFNRYEYEFGGAKVEARIAQGLVTTPKGKREFDGRRNRRSVWTVATKPYAEAHFATFPPDLIKPCILAGCPEGGIVLDPFSGSGTTVATAQELGRRGIGIELNAEYIALAKRRTQQQYLIFEDAVNA